MTSDEVVAKISRNKAFFQFSGGGLTVSGGEPMSQADFVTSIFEKAGAEGIHRALDTSGTLKADDAAKVLAHTDLLLLDVKSTDPDRYKSLTKVSQERFWIMMDEAAKRNVPVWLRHVVVPGITDTLDEIDGLKQLKCRYPNIEKIELLPFHKMGEYKWETLEFTYELADTPEMDKGRVAEMQAMLDAAQCNAG